MTKLTIGMAHFDDFNGVWMTIQALRMFHAEAMDDCELLVVDNSPQTAHGKAVKTFIEGWVKGARYIEAGKVTGTAAPRNRVFLEATGDAVLCMDCHVLIAPGAIKRLIDYFDQNPESKDLLSGPIVYDDLRNISTHFADQWRAEMWGTWATDERGLNPDADPFEIPANGLGVFACRKGAWLGFNPNFREFGGEEWYIHTKFRQAGAKCLCLPFLRWCHRFGRPDGVKFPISRAGKVRNYIVGHKELGLPLDRCKEHFVGEKFISEEEWNMHNLQVDVVISLPEKKNGKCKPCEEEKAKRLETLYESAFKAQSDINEHCPKLRELASQCDHVSEFGMRHSVSSVALLAGQPKRFVTYSSSNGLDIQTLDRIKCKTDFQFQKGSSLEVDIEETDMLFIDTRHTEEQVVKELEKYSKNVRRWIVFHDTQIFGERGEDGGPGLLVGLRKFLTSNQEWSVVYHTAVNHGLTVISKDERDKQKLPGTLQMATNFAKALAAHVIDGLDKVDADTLVARLGICTLCDQRTDNRCAACGCYCEEKASWTSSECPLGKWTAK